MLQFESHTGARHLALPLTLRPARRRQRRRRLWAAGSALALVICGGAAWQLQRVGIGPFGGASAKPETETAALPDLPAPDLFRPLSPEEAIAENAKRPLDAPEIDPAVPFKVSADAISRLRAIDCLTQAIYYEAASEGVDGGRAVAQVVLNRVRHPGYPNSVCGTVYQGSERSTGCQFTFTCDGSLARIPSAYLWNRSRRIAAEALAGKVFAPVGYSTHYHADYVVPYWASSLDKVSVIGRHIFYRLRGAGGTRGAFGQRYAGKEALPDPLPALSPQVEEITNISPDDASLSNAADIPIPTVEEDRVEGIPVGPKAETTTGNPLVEDLARGELLVGGSSNIPKPARRARQDSCAAGTVQRVEQIRPDDLRANAGGPSSC